MNEVADVGTAFRTAYSTTVGGASAVIGAQRYRQGVVLYFR